MSEEAEKKPAQSSDKTGEFFNVGAPLHAVRPGYIRRDADDLLFNTIVAGHYAHVIGPGRTGKTSLVASVSARLQHNGYKVAVLDLAQIGERDGGSEAGRWYYSIAYRLSRQLRLKIDLQMWWQDHSILSHRQRLVEFYVQLVLKNIEENIIVFVDSIEYIANLPFKEHLLPSIRAAHNARTTEPEFNRLGFVTIGDCDPHSLVEDVMLSPFAVATEIRLQDFSREDLDVFSPELNLSSAKAKQALDRVYFWTQGQPYLSQKLCRAISREKFGEDVDDTIDKLVVRQLAGRSAISNEPHLGHLHRLALSDQKKYEALLTLYGRIRKGISVASDLDLPLHRQLLSIGLVVIDDDGNFKVRNRVYEAVFTARWANENLPLRWRGPATAAAIILALTAIPFAYTQLLPKPYLRVMANPTYDLETVADAYQNLRSFPGHVSSADRMYRSVLEDRAQRAEDRNSIRDVARYSAFLPDGAALGDDLTATYWDGKTANALRGERREEALLSSLESLTVTNQERRRLAASLIGDDFPHMLATIPQDQADGMVFSSENVQLTRYRGAEIRQWTSADGSVRAREPWTMSALEVSPLVRRVIVDRSGAASRVGLTVNVSHARLDDIRIRLIAPSGRAAELRLSQSSSAANEEIRIPSEQLRALVGESLSGTWSLSLRDESIGVFGHLVGWKLSLNSQVVVESFERGLDVPDPVERASENLWFSPDGRFAIARALQSDSARIWDLNYALAARTIAVPASETVLGLSENAEFLVTMAQNTVHLWGAMDGRRHAELDLGESATDAVLSANGAHLLVSSRSELDTRIEVWSITSAALPIADLRVAGVPALLSIDAGATIMAVADFDRAVRIWNLRSGQLVSQIDLAAQPSKIELSTNGESLGVILGEQGVSVWNIAKPEVPVFEESGRGEWNMIFSPSGGRFIAGNQREGVQVYRSADGLPSGPLLDPGLSPETDKIIQFSADENQLITAGLNDIARFWSVPVMSTEPAVATNLAAPLGEDRVTVSAIAPDGSTIADGDVSGHIHLHRIDADAGSVVVNTEDVSYLGHRGAVLAVAFSDDATLVASAGADGTVRIWDGSSGSPRPFYGKAEITSVDRMILSPTGDQLAVLSGQRVWLMDTANGEELANIELGESYTDIAFMTDGQLYLGGESGALRQLYADRTGQWHLRNVWRGVQPIRRLAIAPTRKVMVLVDALHEVRLLSPQDGKVSASVLTLPDQVGDMRFSPDESRILFRTSRWVHRALVSPNGAFWTDSHRLPKAATGSQIVFERSPAPESQKGEQLLMLTSDTGQLELAEIHLSYKDGPALFGTRLSLLREWSEKLNGIPTSDYVREGF